MQALSQTQAQRHTSKENEVESEQADDSENVGLLALVVAAVVMVLLVYELAQHQVLVLTLQALALLGGWVVWVRRTRQQTQQGMALQQRADELALALEKEQAQNRSHRAFVAHASQELRTSANGLVGMLGLLDANKLPPSQADCVQTARHGARQLLTLLNDVQDMSSLLAGTMLLKPSAVNLSALAQDLRAFLEPLARAKHLEWAVTADPRLPTWVWVDDMRLRQILLNLLSNAVKFSMAGCVQLEVRRIDAGPVEPGRDVVVRIDVTDQGLGMDEATQARLFRRFEQAHTGHDHPSDGTGFGLEISRHLARLMNGDITVQSTPGEGSVFSFQVSLTCVEAPPQKPAAPSPATAADAHPLGPRNAVVADDSATCGLRVLNGSAPSTVPAPVPA